MQRRVLRRRTHLTADWQLDVDCDAEATASRPINWPQVCECVPVQLTDNKSKHSCLRSTRKPLINHCNCISAHTVIRLTFSVKHFSLFPSCDLCRLAVSTITVHYELTYVLNISFTRINNLILTHAGLGSGSQSLNSNKNFIFTEARLSPSKKKGQAAHVRPWCNGAHSHSRTHTYIHTYARDVRATSGFICTCTLFCSLRLGCCFPVCHSCGALLGAAGNRRLSFFSF